MKLDVTTATGTKSGTVDAPDELFGIEPNAAVLHQVVTAQLAHKRAGTHSTKTRAEVSGGGAKPWRQKGTGRARQGSIRSPQWRGGGIAHGPKPRDYSQRTPKKMIRLALQSALSDRAADGKVMVVDGWGIEEPKTKQALQVLMALGLRPPKERIPRVLLVLDRKERAPWLSFRNLGDRVQIVVPEELNAHDIILNDYVVFSKATLETTSAKFSGSATVKSKAAPAAPAKKATKATKATTTTESPEAADGAPAPTDPDADPEATAAPSDAAEESA